jgi:energy-coupling factor transporter transmembrane protein EcfT
MKGRNIGSWITALFCSAALVLAVVLSDWYLFIPAGILFLLAFRNGRPLIRLLRRVGVLAIILSPLLVCTFLTGPRHAGILSRSGVVIGANMAVRAFCIVLSVAFLTYRISIARILKFFERNRMKGFGLALGVSYNMLFDLSRSGRVVFETLRLRGVVRKKPLKALGLFIVSVIYNALGHADDIVHAASVRGFDTGE